MACQEKVERIDLNPLNALRSTRSTNKPHCQRAFHLRDMRAYP
jgi:hypothetical protein